ncbi:hypothetical protein BJX61DRAFT_542985 [Aspergillus egyptiacus]|nr:hypothetical protein BJX61DRAFT_542985 [Aspergillus egyptiacus]
MVSTGNATGIEDISPQEIRFGFECLRNIDKDGKVDLAKVGEALGYSNVASVGNRFRDLRKRYGFTTLECKTGSTPLKDKTGSKTDGATPTKRGRGRPKQAAPRKGAKASSANPIPATDPFVKSEDIKSEETEDKKICVAEEEEKKEKEEEKDDSADTVMNEVETEEE